MLFPRTLCPVPVESVDGRGYCNRPILALNLCVKHLNESIANKETDDA